MQQQHRTSRHYAQLVGVLLLLGCSLASGQAALKASAHGIWQGALDAGGSRLRVVFHIANTGDNTLVGTMDSPDQGAMGIPISKVTVHANSVVFEVASIGGSFEGDFLEGASTIGGNWKQSGVILPLTLNKMAKALELKRPQEPKPPFPYRVAEVSYENKKDGVTFAGTLTVPPGPGPFPAALLLSGSGPQDRDESMFGHKPFLVIADYLTRRGIAVLRVDDRGVGGSSGGAPHPTMADFAVDARCGVEFLRSRDDIVRNMVGLIGHSEGGTIAPMVAADSNDVAFLVSLSGTGITGDKIIEKQLALIETADGVSREQVRKDVERTRKVHSILVSGEDSTATAERLRNYLKSTVAEWGAEIQSSGVEIDNVVRDQANALLSPWFRYFITYDPKSAWEKVKCPVLAMGGALDLQVSAVDNLKAIGEALQNGGNKDYTTRPLPGLNHVFQHATTGSPKEYGQIEETFSPEALRIMGDWIEIRVKQ